MRHAPAETRPCSTSSCCHLCWLGDVVYGRPDSIAAPRRTPTWFISSSAGCVYVCSRKATEAWPTSLLVSSGSISGRRQNGCGPMPQVVRPSAGHAGCRRVRAVWPYVLRVDRDAPPATDSRSSGFWFNSQRFGNVDRLPHSALALTWSPTSLRPAPRRTAAPLRAPCTRARGVRHLLILHYPRNQQSAPKLRAVNGFLPFLGLVRTAHKARFDFAVLAAVGSAVAAWGSSRSLSHEPSHVSADAASQP